VADNRELERVGMSVEFWGSDDASEWSVSVTFDEPVDDAAHVATGWLVGLRHFCEEYNVNIEDLLAASSLSFATNEASGDKVLN
jgi:hypothetical protein